MQGLTGAVQVRLTSPKGNVRSWSLPSYFASMTSPSLGTAVGCPGIGIHKRIADPMGIVDGEAVNMEIVDAGTTVTANVSVLENPMADVIINGAVALGISEGCKMDAYLSLGIATGSSR